jgi:hypothetical protein
MLERFHRSGPNAFDQAIAQLLHSMNEYGPEEPEYQTKLEQLDKLTKIQGRQNTPIWKRISPDTAAIVVGNLLGILVIVAYEQKSVMTSKAFGYTLKTSQSQ